MRFEGAKTYVAGASAAGQGRARRQQDAAGAGDRLGDRRALRRLARQLNHPRPAGALRIRRRLAAERFAARRPARLQHRQLHPPGQTVGGVHIAVPASAPHRRDRQGGHRVPRRSPARTRSEDGRDDPRQPPSDRHHHLKQGEGAPRRVPAPVFLPLHPFSRRRDDARDRRVAFSEDQAETRRGGDALLLLVARDAGLKKKPTTSELLDWLKLLLNEDISPETLREQEAKKLIPPLHGALLKNEQDVHLFEKLAFLSRRER